MEILNLDWRDYHMHSSDFSDWTSTIDEIVKFAWEIWLTEIAITDHSDISLEKSFPKLWNKWFTNRWNFSRWKNVFNDVNVIIWVEWDLLNEDWDVCFAVQWIEPEFIILSAHIKVYEWNSENITNWYINAIERYHYKIKFIWHPCNTRCFAKYLDMEKLIEVCNKYDIPMELDACDLINDFTDFEKLDLMLKKAKYIYINSDAHSLWELREARKLAIKYLKDNKYI